MERGPPRELLDNRDRHGIARPGCCENFLRLVGRLESRLLPGGEIRRVLGDRRGTGIDVVLAAVADRVELARGSVVTAVKLPVEDDGGAESRAYEQEREVGHVSGDAMPL